MVLLDHDSFLDRLRDDPADTDGWLVYADWLDEQADPTGVFVRHALDFTTGRVPIEPHGAHVSHFYQLSQHAHPETRKLLGEYRTALPLRLQVCDCLRIGHNPPRDIGGYARTIVVVAVLSGRIELGTWLRSEDGAWRPTRPVRGMEVFMKTLDVVEAGSAISTVGVFYLGHHSLRVGTILVEGPAEADPFG
jgi:uncharacterized protein (TIGR02996 family)